MQEQREKGGMMDRLIWKGNAAGLGGGGRGRGDHFLSGALVPKRPSAVSPHFQRGQTKGSRGIAIAHASNQAGA